MERPKIAPKAFVRINMVCRVCDAMIECYVLEKPEDKFEATLHDAAFLGANKMQVHMQEKHDYPRSLFLDNPEEKAHV